jgi:Tfp pilus assembly protein PilF
MTSLPEALQAGLEHHRAGRLLEAEQMYLHVLSLHPRHAGAVHLLGLLAFQAGRLDVSEQLLTQAVTIDAFHAPYSADLGEIYRAQGRIADAIAAYRKAIALNANVADFHNNLGTLLTTAGDPHAAVAELREALRLDPNHAEVAGNLGAALLALGQVDEALPWFEKAAPTAAQDGPFYLNFGTCLYAQGRTLDAIACLQRAARLQPNNAEAHYRCALARLAQGDYPLAWPDFEWRVHCPGFARGESNLPRWNGLPSRGQRMLIRADNDLSTTLLLLRYAKFLGERGATTVFDLPAPLVRLVAESGYDNVVPEGQSAAPCNVQVPLWSLPGMFGTTTERIPIVAPYLRADEQRAAHWRAQLESIAGFKVGIAWRANPADPFAAVRTIPFDALDRLAGVAGARLVSLELDGPERTAPPAERSTVVSLVDSDGNTPQDLADVGAIIQGLDLVIAADATIAHLAGALGANVWVALSKGCDWCWMKDRDDTPWYPTARLFRQTQAGDWGEVFARIAESLAPLAASHSSSQT